MILVGIGPGDLKYASFEAIETIKNSKKVLAFRRIGEEIKHLNKVEYINKLDDLLYYGDEYTLVVSGDPLLYSALDYLTRQKVKIEKVVPSISSFQYMLCRIKKSWNEAVILSFHGRDIDITGIKRPGLTVVFTDSTNTPNKLSRLLYEKGYKGKIYVGFNLSYDDEVILEREIGDYIENISDLSLAVLEVCG